VNLVRAHIVTRGLSRELIVKLYEQIDPRNALAQQRFLGVLREHGAMREAAKKARALVSRPPAVQTGRQRIWTSMRIEVSFTAQSIAASAQVELVTARQYINALIGAGYARKTRQTSFEVGDYTTFRLVKNTGPHAPRLRSDGSAILDLNRPEGEREIPIRKAEAANG
jgi:hypothetical protein